MSINLFFLATNTLQESLPPAMGEFLLPGLIVGGIAVYGLYRISLMLGIEIY